MGKVQAGGALAIGVGDRIAMLENAIYSILSPEGFASILYKDSTQAKKAAEKMKITAQDLQTLGIIDDIIKEPKEGIQNDFEKVIINLKRYLLKNIKDLQKLSLEELLVERYEKYRKIY